MYDREGKRADKITGLKQRGMKVVKGLIWLRIRHGSGIL